MHGVRNKERPGLRKPRGVCGSELVDSRGGDSKDHQPGDSLDEEEKEQSDSCSLAELCREIHGVFSIAVSSQAAWRRLVKGMSIGTRRR